MVENNYTCEINHSKLHVKSKDYLGTRSFPKTTDVTNSLEYSIASTLGIEGEKKRKKKKELNHGPRT